MAARNPRPTGRPRPPIAAEAGEAGGVAVGGDTELHPEADAIIGVIRDGISAIRQKDFEAWAESWVQTSHVRRMGTQGWDPAEIAPYTGLVVHDGWDDIKAFMKRMLGDESVVFFPTERTAKTGPCGSGATRLG